LRLFRAASNYIQGAHAAHIHIYTYIRVDWNLYFSLSPSLSLFSVFSYACLYRSIRIEKKRRRRRRRRRRRHINESHCHYQLFFFGIFNSKNKLVNSTNTQTKSVSQKNVFLYFYDLFLYNLLKTSLVRVYCYIHMRTEVSYIWRHLWTIIYVFR